MVNKLKAENGQNVKKKFQKFPKNELLNRSFYTIYMVGQSY